MSVTRPKRRWARGAAATALAATAIIGISGCSSSTSSDSASQSAVTSGKHLSVAEFSSAIQQPGTVVLDVRTPAEYASGHIEGARNIDFESGNFATDITGLDKNTTYAIYCRSGSRSGQALTQMSDAGFTSVSDLDGGIVAWEAAGKPVV
ncbi:MAG: rhodanese-like domain-containing protein [Candidatus Nanopelagicales bacterium]